MHVKVIAFGMLADIVEPFDYQSDGIILLGTFKDELEKKFPRLSEKKYSIAVNKKITGNDDTITDDSTVALLPPFSGG
jgi:molybdopterin synthase sulfur carrier subunit